jgi:hypothetical protein
MQKLLAILAAGLAFSAVAASEPQRPASPPGNAPVSGAPTTQANVGEKRAREQSFADAQRACTSRMQMHSPRGRGAPNWNVYDYCMRERGHAQG